MAFTRVAALLHAALSDVTTSQHHVATVAGDLDLADLNARAHADLSDSPEDAHHVRLRETFNAIPQAVSGTGATIAGRDRGAMGLFGDDSADQNAFWTWLVPSDFVVLRRAVLRIKTIGGNGNVRHTFLAYSGAAVGEIWNTNSDSIAAATLAMVDEEVAEVDISTLLTNIAAGDNVQINYTRNGSLAADTILTLDVDGIIIEWE